MTLLTLSGISKRFSGLTVLDGVDLAVPQGERHAIIGPNGSGKSTLFNVISGRLSPTSGKVIYRDRRIDGWRSHRIARLGIGRSFQILNIFQNLTAFENVRSAVASLRGLRLGFWRPLAADREVAAAADRALAEVGLDGKRDRLACQLSYGEQRQLELALTVAAGPELVLLDEPCAGLNAQDTRHAVTLIQRLTQGRTLLLVEHDMHVVFDLADRISVLYYGRILATGTPAQIRGDERVRRAYLGRKASVVGS